VRQRILVVEDERDIAELIRLHLSDLDYVVTIARDGNDGLRAAFAQQWSLVILDLRLPGIDGLDICRRIRQQSAYVPILMLTSKSSELDRVVGLEVGADDYVTKPFSVLELTAREFDLLLYFASNPGRVFRRSELLDRVWGYGHDGYEHTVNSHINRLRAKIEDDPSNPQLIVTVWGVGYKMGAPAAQIHA